MTGGRGWPEAGVFGSLLVLTIPAAAQKPVPAAVELEWAECEFTDEELTFRDQRGTGRSRPHLCPEMDRAEIEQAAQGQRRRNASTGS